MNRPKHLTIHVHREDGDSELWADIDELPGCFASGRDMNELREALNEAVSLYLSEPGQPVHLELEVTEERASVRVAC
jgi:predicted RNase H-like HicB family nuclease